MVLLKSCESHIPALPHFIQNLPAARSKLHSTLTHLLNTITSPLQHIETKGLLPVSSNKYKLRSKNCSMLIPGFFHDAQTDYLCSNSSVQDKKEYSFPLINCYFCLFFLKNILQQPTL